MGCSGIGGASSAAYSSQATAAKPKQVAANSQTEIDILAQLASGTDSDSDSDGTDGTIDITA